MLSMIVPEPANQISALPFQNPLLHAEIKRERQIGNGSVILNHGSRKVTEAEIYFIQSIESGVYGVAEGVQIETVNTESKRLLRVPSLDTKVLIERALRASGPKEPLLVQLARADALVSAYIKRDDRGVTIAPVSAYFFKISSSDSPGEPYLEIAGWGDAAALVHLKDNTGRLSILDEGHRAARDLSPAFIDQVRVDRFSISELRTFLVMTGGFLLKSEIGEPDKAARRLLSAFNAGGLDEVVSSTHDAAAKTENGELPQLAAIAVKL